MHDNHKIKLLYAVGIGLILSDIIPTPADSIYFIQQQKNKELLEKKQITPEQYWTRDVIMYYGLNPLWWASILGISALTGNTFEQKRNILIALIAGGAVLTVIHRNIKKDNEFYSKTKILTDGGTK